MSITLEQAVAFASILGALGSGIVFLWRIFKAITRAEQKQEELNSIVATIQKEVTYNGGASIKDMILSLGRTCERIEVRQKVIDQRSKAALHYQDRCLFETDRVGNLIWANEAFYHETAKCGDISGGLDWITVVHEDYREEFVKELKSCLEMSRRLEIDTVCSSSNTNVRFSGYPYRIGSDIHEGFLIQLHKERQ